jgi:hypothetical protein
VKTFWISHEVVEARVASPLKVPRESLGKMGTTLGESCERIVIYLRKKFFEVDLPHKYIKDVARVEVCNFPAN